MLINTHYYQTFIVINIITIVLCVSLNVHKNAMKMI